jgi:hypothetical protein
VVVVEGELGVPLMPELPPELLLPIEPLVPPELPLPELPIAPLLLPEPVVSEEPEVLPLLLGVLVLPDEPDVVGDPVVLRLVQAPSDRAVAMTIAKVAHLVRDAFIRDSLRGLFERRTGSHDCPMRHSR